MLDADELLFVEVRPSMTEWSDLPNTVRMALPLVRGWTAELARDAQERAGRAERAARPGGGSGGSGSG